MSKFPTKETFKSHKSKPQEFIENIIPQEPYLFSRNILPKKVKKIYIYDIFGQKFADFFLDYGRYYLGFSDKYITRMLKDYLGSTIFSYSNGIFTYRFLKTVRDVTNFDFKLALFVRDYESLSLLLKELSNGKVSANSEYLSSVLSVKFVSKKPLIFDPFSEVLELRDLVSSTSVVFLGRGLRYPEVLNWLPNVDANVLILNFGKFFGVFVRDKRSNSLLDVVRRIWRGMSFEELGRVYNISEFDSVLGYYYILRETFLVKKKLFRLRNYTSRWLSKFVNEGFFDVLTPYSARVRRDRYKEDMNKFLLSEGILTHRDILFFSFQTEEPDFNRLRRKINQYIEKVSSGL